jgi:aminoglycoside N3'-acetyltransferase
MMAQGETIDLRSAQPNTGIITETFRTWPEVRRSSHPFSSVCALGPSAEELIAGHAGDPHVCHAESPVGRLVAANAKIAGLGVPLSVGLSVAHYLEDTYGKFPFTVHSPPFTVRYVDTGGNTVTRDVIRYDPDVAETRIDHPKGTWILRMFTDHFTRRGILCWFRFGQADAWVMNAQPLFDELKRLADKGITMYLTQEQWLTMNDGRDGIKTW